MDYPTPLFHIDYRIYSKMAKPSLRLILFDYLSFFSDDIPYAFKQRAIFQ